MKCLIRKVIRKSAAGQVHQDSTVETEMLTIGRAAGQHVFLSDMQVALEHAVIKPLGKGRFGLQACGANQIRVNRRILQSAIVTPGDKLGIGHATLSVIAPPAGYDLAIEILLMTSDVAKPRDGVGALSLKAAGASARPWAWLLFLLVLGLGLGIPLFAGIRTMQAHAQLDAHSRGTTAESNTMLAVMPESANLPGNGLWSPGPMSEAHRFIGKDCARCHTAPFVPVQNSACLSCHINLAAHGDSAVALAAVDFKQSRCTACHQEHSRGEATLVSSASSTCTDCHAHPHTRMSGSTLPAVDDFGGNHPQFRVALLQLGDDWHFSTHMVSMDDARPERMPGLKFPHDKHLVATGIKRSDGSLEMLTCGSCHIPDPGKVGFLPQTFEQQCQRCHELSFEATDPGARLPHGNVQAAWSFLQGYYARLALAGGVNAPGAPAAVMAYRRPDQVLAPNERQAALAWADEKAATAATEVFSYRLCVTCHVVRQAAGGETPWVIAPVMQQTHWFPSAAFVHGTHATMSCDSCHAARLSKTNEDVLMPKIAVCRECHAGGSAATSGMEASSNCINCHAFHKALRHTMAGSFVPADFLVQPLVSHPH
jgi:predicted CXXCH cytochrome family protein